MDLNSNEFKIFYPLSKHTLIVCVFQDNVEDEIDIEQVAMCLEPLLA